MRQTIRQPYPITSFYSHRDEELERFPQQDSIRFAQYLDLEACEGDLGVEMTLEGHVCLLRLIAKRLMPMWRMPATTLVKSRSSVSSDAVKNVTRPIGH